MFLTQSYMFCFFFALLLGFVVSFAIGAYLMFWQGHSFGWDRGYDAAIIQFETGEDVHGDGYNPFPTPEIDPFE